MRSKSKGTRRATPNGMLLLALAGGVALSLVASACGSGSPSEASSSGRGLRPAVRFAQCMRANGVIDWPDPSGNGGSPSLNGIDANSSAFQTAYQACRKDLTSGGVGPPAPTAAQLRFAVEFAQCIRRHGFPQFPDPLTTYGPGFTLGQGMYFPLHGTYQVQSSGFRQAAKACGVQLPSGPP